MLLSKLKRLLPQTKREISQKAKKQSEETCVQSEINNVTDDFTAEDEAQYEVEESQAFGEENSDPDFADADTEDNVKNEETESYSEAEVGKSNFTENSGEVNSIPRADTKAHLKTSVPRAASIPTGAMTRAEMREARELFRGLDDGEIHRLYKKVTQ